jgi:hypothetical protein
MPSKYEERRRFKSKQQEKNDRHPMLVLCLLEERDVRRTQFDSTAGFHRFLQKEVGAIALASFNLPLNGRGGQFENVCKGPADILLFHRENNGDDTQVIKVEAERLSSLLPKIKAANYFIKIYATPEAAQFMPKNIHVNRINSITDITKKIKR